MKKIAATILKEWIIMKRDIGGMALILFMPSVLMIVMSLVEDAPYRNMQEVGIDILLVDNDRSTVSTEMANGLKKNKNFHIIDSADSKELTEARLKEILKGGKYKLGIVIPNGTAAELANATNLLANNIASKFGTAAVLPVRKSRDSIYIHVYFSPEAKPIFRSAVKVSLDKYFIYAGSDILMKKLASLPSDADTGSTDLRKAFTSVRVEETPLSKNEAIYISSVQQNVPAWAIFGMFLIAVPMANHLVREREEGSYTRTLLIPHAILQVSLGKIFYFTIICFVQFFMMLAIGIWILPLMDLSSLYLGAHPWVLVPVALAVSFASTSYGFFVSSSFTTTNQAMPFGSISVVILSALGGIWMPVSLLSPFMQKLAVISPLRWSHAAINEVILNDSNLSGTWQYLTALIGFGICLCCISYYINNNRQQSFK